MEKKRILGASIGNCVHVAGVMHFLQYAREEGYQTLFLGPATPIHVLFEAIENYQPDIIALSYRLTPSNLLPLMQEVQELRSRLSCTPLWAFGGTPPVAEVAKEFDFFAFVSDGYDDINDTIKFLRKQEQGCLHQACYPQTLTERIANSYPYPLLRHHFGLPSFQETVKGIGDIANAKVLDIISIGPDQNTQQFFFRQAQRRLEYDGAGGVPIRSKDEFATLKSASQTGNHPLMRCYSGTADVLDYAQLLIDSIDNAWPAIPLFWYNEIDGRGTRTIEQSIVESQKLIQWHAQLGLPVEINDPHHWALRDAHDVMSVATAYLAAYNAKLLGVKTYIAQYMFNVPHGISFSMDLARTLAMKELVESLVDDDFTVLTQTRAGLPLFSADENIAKGQLASSTLMQLALKPHIIHVVGFCEANHAATAENIIESCKIVKGVLRHTLNDNLPIEKSAHIVERKDELLAEARELLSFIQTRFSNHPTPLADPLVLAECVKQGYLDAVHIMKNDKFKGTLSTRIVQGKCVAQNSKGELITEKERLMALCHE